MEQCQQSFNDIKPLLDKLQLQWELYLDSNEDTDIKKSSLEQFLYNFQFIDKKVLQHEAFKSFFNTIPEEVCSFFLELVNEIISQSDLFTTGHISNAKDSDDTYKESSTMKQENWKALKRHHNFAQLVLRNPSDCNKIIALRTFLTDQLGQHLLKFLSDVDIKLITSQKSLCNLCINLFPNCTWTETMRELNKSISLNEILSNFYFHQYKHKNKILQQQRSYNLSNNNNNNNNNNNHINVNSNSTNMSVEGIFDFDVMRANKNQMKNATTLDWIRDHDHVDNLNANYEQSLYKDVEENESDEDGDKQGKGGGGGLSNGNRNLNGTGNAKNLEKFRLEKKTSDEIALILIGLLKKCIRQEYDQILSEQSMTIITLNFALNCLQSPNDDINYASPHNAEIIKTELLHLIQMCCNNLFVNIENVNVVQFPIIFAKLNEALIINERKCLNITCALIFLILSILYNVTAIYGSQQTRYNLFNYKAMFKSQQYIDKSIIEMCMSILQKLTKQKDVSQVMFGHIFKTLLRITDQLNKCERYKSNHNNNNNNSCNTNHNLNNSNNSNNNYQHNGNDVQQRHALRKRNYLKHSHCSSFRKESSPQKKTKANQTASDMQSKMQGQGHEHEFLSCFFQKTLLLILPSLSYDLQEQAMRYFLKSGICCCHYTLTSYGNILQVALSVGVNYQRCAYKFLQKFILSGIFLRNPNVIIRKRFDNSMCLSCDEKFKSREFQNGLLKLYVEMHEKIVSSNDHIALEVFLKHLKRISHLLPYDMANGILAEIVLPIFRSWKAKLIAAMENAQTNPNKPNKSPVKSGNSQTSSTSASSSVSTVVTPTSYGKKMLLLNINAAQQESQLNIKEQQQFILNIINECLNIFAMYLCDIRIVKAFYNEENIKHLEDLLNEPELIRSICDLIKIGIDNITFLGDNQQEQIALSRRLINLQLNSSDRAAQLFTQLLIKIQNYINSNYNQNNTYNNNNNSNSNNNQIKFWIDDLNLNENHNLSNNSSYDFLFNHQAFNSNTNKKLTILHILHITALQWSLNYDLLKTSQLFYNEFAKTYSIVHDDLHLDDTNEPKSNKAENPKNADENGRNAGNGGHGGNGEIGRNVGYRGEKEEEEAAASLAKQMHHPNLLKHGDKTIIDILKLNFNALSCFLLLPNINLKRHQLFTSYNYAYNMPLNNPNTSNANPQTNTNDININMNRIDELNRKTNLYLPLNELKNQQIHLNYQQLLKNHQDFKANEAEEEEAAADVEADLVENLNYLNWLDKRIASLITTTNKTNSIYIYNKNNDGNDNDGNHHDDDDDSCKLWKYNTIDCCISQDLENAYEKDLKYWNFSVNSAFAPATYPIDLNYKLNRFVLKSFNKTNESFLKKLITLQTYQSLFNENSYNQYIFIYNIKINQLRPKKFLINSLLQQQLALSSTCKLLINNDATTTTTTTTAVSLNQLLYTTLPFAKTTTTTATITTLSDINIKQALEREENEQAEEEEEANAFCSKLNSRHEAAVTAFAEGDYLINGQCFKEFATTLPDIQQHHHQQQQHSSTPSHNSSSIATPNSLIGNIVNIFGWLFGGATPTTTATTTPTKTNASNANITCPKDKEFEDQLFSLFQVNGDGKKLLLKLFEATMAICIKGYQNEEVEKMQKHLRKLKAAILSSAYSNWDQYGQEQTRDNIIIQTLQTLLKIAELSSTLNEPAEVIGGSSLINAQIDDERLPLHMQTRSLRCSQMICTPVLPAVNAVATPPTPRRPLSGESADADYFSTRASFICADSELEFSDNNDDFYLTADEGYEADGEVPDATDTDADCMEAVDLWNALQPTSRYRTHILHDGLCRLVVEILIELSTMCIQKPNGWTDSLAQLANRLFIIRDYLGGPLYLLKGFQPIFECNDPKLKELQQLLLESISDFNTPDVLTTFFSIISSKKAPVDILIKYMHFLCTNTLRKPQPYVELEFPISPHGKCISTCDFLLTEQIEKVRNYHLQCQANTPMTRAPLIIPVTNAKLWSSDGFTTSLWFNIKGSGHNQKATASQLIEEDSRSSSDDGLKTHLISLGTNQVMLSVYVNTNMNLIFEVCKPNAEVQILGNEPSMSTNYSQTNDKKQTPLASTQLRLQTLRSEGFQSSSPFRNALKQTKMALFQSFSQMHLFNGQANDCDQHFEISSADMKQCRLPRNKWTHLVFAVETQQDRIDVTIYIDGFERQVISLPFKNIKNFIKNYTFQVVAVGDGSIAKSPNTSTYTDSRSTLDSFPMRYAFTNLMLFNRKITVPECFLNLTAMGPDFAEFTQCQVGNWKPNYGYLNLTRMSSANFGNLYESMRLLKHTRILSYTAQKPDLAMSYKTNLDTNGIYEGNTCGLIFYAKLIQNELSSIQTAVILSGGLSTLLYLFARVVETSNNSLTQAMALDMLYRVAMSESQLFTEFICSDYINLIGFVIKSDRCTKDVNLLKSIINNACTHQVITKKGDVLQVNDNTIASIIHPRIIISVLHRYSDWHRSGVENSKVLETIFQCIIALTREKHPHRDFNMEQLNKVNLLRELLNICKVYIIESPNPVYISKLASLYFVQIISVFAGSPPTPSLLDEIMKLLLLLHRPSDCYVTHDRANLYFILSSFMPGKEKSNTGVNLGRVTAPFRKNILKDRLSTSLASKSTQASSDLSKERQARIQRLQRLHFNDFPSYRRPVHELEENLENIADCSKLNKGALRLINPMEAKRCHSKLKRKIGNTNCLASPKKVNDKASSKDKMKSIAVLSPVQGNNIASGLQPKVTRKRLRSNNSLRYTESEKRMRKDRLSKGSLQSISQLFSSNYDTLENAEVFGSSSNTSAPKRARCVTKTDFYKFEGIIALQEGLLLLLKDFLCLLPDTTVDEVLKHYVKLEYLVVLANHSDCSVRTAIIKLLGTLTQRLSVNDLNAFIKNLYPQHLGNQLAIHPANEHMFEACLTWLTGIYGNLETYLLIHKIEIHQRFGINALLSLLSKSTQPQPQTQQHDFSLMAFRIFHRIFTKNPDDQQAFIEAGLLQACIKALYNLYAQTSSMYNTKTEDSIIELLTLIGSKSLTSNGHIHTVWEILNLLSFYQSKQPLAIVKAFRSVQGLLQLNWLNMFFVDTNVPPLYKVSLLPNCQLHLNEVKTRLDLLVDRCTQFFMVFDSNYMPSTNEVKLFELLVSYCITTNQKCINFIAWGLLPSRPRDVRAFIVDALWARCREEFSTPFLCDGKMIKSLLWLSLHEDLDKPIENLKSLCKHLGITENDPTWNLENELDNIESNRSKMCAKQKAILEKNVSKYETLAQNCVESSLVITRRVAELQNAERKLLMSYMRDYDDTVTYTQWVDIIKRLTHEGGPWYNNNYAETSWELDDTEGPSRVHTRLRRCHLDIDKRFFMADYANAPNDPSPTTDSKDPTHSSATNLTTNTPSTASSQMQSSALSTTSTNSPILPEHTRPLEYLIANYEQQMNISLNSPINYNFPAKYLPIDEEIDGEIIITDHKLYFFATYRCKYFYINCDIANIAEIWPKRYQHQERAFEIFLDTNRSLFFSLQSQDDYKKMTEIFCNKMMGATDQIKLSAITQQWRDGQLTNWEYLMTLNQIAGRTYNDLMQYPVFPWILSNYHDHVLDLTDAKNYRKLEKPIAVQNPESEQHYISNYMHMSNTETNMGSLPLKPYHYSSHYSNSGTVLHFLVRVPPFTSFFLRYQDNNFDLPDRTFHALSTTWCLASRDSSTDVKELIPEFFCLPEMFENLEHFNFGCRQSGERVEDVTLPPWCSNDARLFVLIHRQALESEHVRKVIHNWIDLIFGYKQTGESAVEAVNVFHPATYPTFLESPITDPIQRDAVETMVKTLGQMPRQLFKTPHPASNPLNYALSDDKRVIPSVNGLRWGIYVGSPQLPPPVLNPSHRLPEADYLISFSNTNVVYGMSAKKAIMQGAEPDTYNVISWGHEDRIVRIEPLNKAQARPRNLLFNNAFDDITACGCDPNSNQLWFGHKSGRISVYKCNGMAGDGSNWQNKSRQSYVKSLKFSYNSAIRKITTKSGTRGDPDLDCEIQNASLTSSASSSTLSGALQGAEREAVLRDGADLSWIGPIILIRHTDEVTCITLSVEYKIVVSAGRDGLAVIWDLNNWNFVRVIERPAEIHQSPISLVAISPTLGDIVTVHSIVQPSEQEAAHGQAQGQGEGQSYSPETHVSKATNDNPLSTRNASGGGTQHNREENKGTPRSSTSNVADECFEVTEDLDDFVNVSMNLNGKSILRLHTVNGRYVQHMVLDERILAVCYSYVKEGVGVNVIATAVEGGIIRLWSSWNLSFVNQILTGTTDVKSITYSTHQHLVVLTKESYIQVWECGGLSGTSPKFPQNQFKKSI